MAFLFNPLHFLCNHIPIVSKAATLDLCGNTLALNHIIQVRRKTNSQSMEDMAENGECRGKICLEAHGIGYEISTMLCFGRIEADREGVRGTEKK